MDGTQQFGLINDVRAAVAGLVRDGLKSTGASAPVIAVENDTMRATSARVQALYDAEKISVCVDRSDARIYRFCTSTEQMSENEFIRRYGKMTGSQELEPFLVDHRKRESTGKYLYVAGGAVLAIAGGVVTYWATTQAISWETEGSPANAAMGLGITGLAGGGWLLWHGISLNAENVSGQEDADPAFHNIKEPEARRYVDAYNRVLLERMNREWSGNALLHPARRERLFEPSVRLVVAPSGIGLVGTF